jgi:ABC-type antimicrobial peptide transport system permease subunit
MPVFEARTVAGQVGLASYVPRLITLLLSGFGMLTLTMACIGLYGNVAFSVTQRTREVGIRMALGARQGQVIRMVVRQWVRLAMVGLAIGIVLAGLAMQPLSRLLFGISPVDIPTFGVVALLLWGVAALASYVPARRAARADPMVTLRYE